MISTITLTTVGADSGPYDLYSNYDSYAVPFESGISKIDLIAGYTTLLVPELATIVRIVSVGICTNYIDVVIPPQSCFKFLPENTSYITSQINKTTAGYFYGAFTGYEETGIPTTSSNLIRLNIDLTIDSYFDIGVGFDEVLYSGSSIIEQIDGKIIATGTFTLYQGVSANRIIRLNTDGSRDTGFVIGSGFDNLTQHARLDSDNNILVTGLFGNYNGSSSPRIIRLLPNGSVDATFIVGSGFDNTTTDVLPNTDNSMYVTGYYSTYKGISADTGIVKLDSTGSVDPTFIVGAGLNPHSVGKPIYLCRIAGESSFYAAGEFTTYQGIPEPYIIKINSIGEKDLTFDAGTGFDDVVGSISVIWDDKLLIEGSFLNYNGIPANNTIILNANGTILYSSSIYYNTPIIIGNNLFGKQDIGCFELLYTKL